MGERQGVGSALITHRRASSSLIEQGIGVRKSAVVLREVDPSDFTGTTPELVGGGTMWSDNDTRRDFLNFRCVADTAAELIIQADGTPLSMGVSGGWRWQVVDAQLDQRRDQRTG